MIWLQVLLIDRGKYLIQKDINAYNADYGKNPQHYTDVFQESMVPVPREEVAVKTVVASAGSVDTAQYDAPSAAVPYSPEGQSADRPAVTSPSG